MHQNFKIICWDNGTYSIEYPDGSNFFPVVRTPWYRYQVGFKPSVKSKIIYVDVDEDTWYSLPDFFRQ